MSYADEKKFAESQVGDMEKRHATEKENLQSQIDELKQQQEKTAVEAASRLQDSEKKCADLKKNLEPKLGEQQQQFAAERYTFEMTNKQLQDLMALESGDRNLVEWFQG